MSTPAVPRSVPPAEAWRLDLVLVALPPALPLTGLSRMLRGCASLGAAAVGVGGLAYLAKASTPVPVGDMMHPGHTRPLRNAAELSSFLDTNVAAGKTVFVRWIASPK